MAKLLQIAQLGHPVLRKTAAPIENTKDAALQCLVEDMLATVTDVSGFDRYASLTGNPNLA